MSEINKTESFLDAIKKYSEQERQKVFEQLEEKKRQELKKTEIKAKADAEHYLNRELSEIKAEVTSEYAEKTLESKGALYKKRTAMIDEIFELAASSLTDYTETDEYREKLLSYAREISDVFGGNKCVLYLKSGDMKFADEIRAVFNSDTEINEDIKIRIGGIRGECPALRIVADNTLDSKLESQREWFVENADLKIK